MKILEGKEAKGAEKFLEKAVEVAKKSICSVSSVGVVVVKNGKVIGEAFNGPLEKACSPCLLEIIDKRAKTELCYAMHAEERAIMNAMEKGHAVEGAEIYSVRTRNGKSLPYKNGFCAACGRVFMEAGLAKIIIPKKEGLVEYEPEEFYDLSFDRFVKKRFIM